MCDLLPSFRAGTRGVRVVTNVVRNAVDVKALPDERRLFTDGEVVWSWRPKALAPSSSEAEMLHESDGGKREGSPRRAPINRKPLRREGRLSPPVPVAFALAQIFFCARAPGAAATRPSLRPRHLSGGW